MPKLSIKIKSENMYATELYARNETIIFIKKEET